MMRDPEKITVSLAVESQLFRDGLRAITSADDAFVIVAEAASGQEAVRSSARWQPDVLLLDVPMSGMSPVMTIRQVSKVAQQTRIVVLSMHLDNDLIVSLAAAGAAAYLSKEISGCELCSQLRSIAHGVQAFTLRLPGGLDAAGPDVPSTATSLTDREIEVLRLVSLAMSNSEIASQLYVSEATVKRHLTNAFTKLKARSRLDAVNRAMALGVLVSVAEAIERSFY